MASAGQVARQLFQLSSRSESASVHVLASGRVHRLAIDRGFVHALANVGDRGLPGDERLRRLLDRLPPDAQATVAALSPEGSFDRVTPFHPAKVVRAHIEALLDEETAAQLRESHRGKRLRLLTAPHPTSLAADEPRLIAFLLRACTIEELQALAGAVPRRVDQLLVFLDAAGVLRVEDPLLGLAYVSLGLVEGAPAGEVKRAYRRLALELHPDRHPDAADAERQALAARFDAVQLAYRRILPNG